MPIADLSTIQSDSVEQNVKFLNSVLDGEPGPATNVVLLNAGSAIKVSGKVNSIYEGIKLARKSIESGAARSKLERLIEISRTQK